ncbi:MAG: histidinol-phosphate transaminase, partial [Bacteroidota bacterium]|nr:histidinol-phosphate transaminase [Bacteroidota bacterium]
MFELDKLVRDNIRKLKPYSSARDEYSGEAAVFLDANENPFNAPYNRYPDPRQSALKDQISTIKKVPAENIFLGNGSDEPIDLVYRAFCEPGRDRALAIAPTYGMYRVAADINNIGYDEVALNEDFTFSADKLLAAVSPETKLIFLCSPNNPSANCLDRQEMLKVLRSFNGIVIVDEAYIDFCPQQSLLPLLSEYPNLVIFQTFSKAWGMAGIRLGMAFASPEIIGILSKIKYPYNINVLTLEEAAKQLTREKEKNHWVETLLYERTMLAAKLESLEIVSNIFPSDANFLLVKVDNPRSVYEYLVEEK